MSTKLSYSEKLKDVRWQRKRWERLQASNWTCFECGFPLQEGAMDLQVHHVHYILGRDPWDYPDALLLVLCDRHHKARQAAEQAILLNVAVILAEKKMEELLRQPIFTFFEDEDTLNYLPIGQREALLHERELDEIHAASSAPAL